MTLGHIVGVAAGTFLTAWTARVLRERGWDDVAAVTVGAVAAACVLYGVSRA